MNARLAIFTGALLGLLFAACGGGGPSAGACNPSTCSSGCCDANGVCQGGFTPQACGSSGLTCSVCSDGTTCQFGFCVPTSTSGGGAGGGAGGGSMGGGGGATGGGGGATGGGGGDAGGGGGHVGGGAGGGGCTRATCEQLGKNCGEVSDGCGGVLLCGGCTAPQTCGGGGTANVCGAACVPKTCEQLGPTCGMVSDTCGGTLDCGACNTRGLVVSQVFGGGGNAGATWTNDFVELFNGGTAPVSLAGWSVQYASATGSTWQVTPLSGFIAPGRRFLVAQAGGTNGTTPLPTADVVGSIGLAAGAGKIALVRGTTPLAGSCPLGADVVDLVGYGTADCREGAGNAPAPSATLAILRNGGGCSDTNDNATDFALASPTPRNSSGASQSCP
ncbi:MAG: lamin tail domain-containing protein [Myxococcota bacterium]|jgi:hypothetical protein